MKTESKDIQEVVKSLSISDLENLITEKKLSSEEFIKESQRDATRIIELTDRLKYECEIYADKYYEISLTKRFKIDFNIDVLNDFKRPFYEMQRKTE